MGNCSLCGQPAGIFRRKHDACAAKHQDHWKRMILFAVTAARGEEPLEAVPDRLKELASSGYVPESRISEALVRGWEQAVAQFLEDGLLDETEEKHILEYKDYFSFSQDQLDVRGAYDRVVKGAVLRDVVNGKIPQRITVQGRLPFVLQKKEQLVWLFQGVKYSEDRKRREYRGGSHGVSIRIAKGVYYRVGAFAAQPIEHTETVHVDTGLLGMTNRHLYFGGSQRNFRVRHDKIVAVHAYSDGVRIQRDAATARPQYFITGDGWFTYNLLMNASNL